MRDAIFHLTFAVWGRDYADFFAHSCLPSMLAPGNIPEIAARTTVRVSICTTEQDREFLTQHPSIRLLTEYAHIDFLELPTKFSSKYDRITIATRMAMDQTKSESCLYGFLPCDVVVGATSLGYLWEKFQEGYDATLTIGLRADKEKFLSRFPRTGAALEIENAALCDVLLETLHWTISSRKWDGDLVSVPSYLLWGDASVGFVARAFHLHPVAVYLAANQDRLVGDGTVDAGFFLSKACPDTDRIHVAQDATKFVAVDVSASGSHEAYELFRLGARSDIAKARSVASWTHSVWHPQIIMNASASIAFPHRSAPRALDPVQSQCDADMELVLHTMKNWDAELQAWRAGVLGALEQLAAQNEPLNAWGAGTDWEALCAEYPTRVRELASRGLRLFDRSRAGLVFDQITIEVPDFGPHTGKLVLTTSAATTRRAMKQSLPADLADQVVDPYLT